MENCPVWRTTITRKPGLDLPYLGICLRKNKENEPRRTTQKVKKLSTNSINTTTTRAHLAVPTKKTGTKITIIPALPGRQKERFLFGPARQGQFVYHSLTLYHEQELSSSANIEVCECVVSINLFSLYTAYTAQTFMHRPAFWYRARSYWVYTFIRRRQPRLLSSKQPWNDVVLRDTSSL